MNTAVVASRRIFRHRTEPVRAVCFGWSQSFSSFGRRFRIRTNDPALLKLLPDLLPPLTVPSRAVSFDRTFSLRRAGACSCGTQHTSARLFGGRQLLFDGPDVTFAGPRLRTAIKLDVAEFARRRVFLHAGAVGWNGMGIVIPGATMSGKTSLVRALLQAGAIYYSDEYAVLDDLGYLHPYPQPLGVRVGTSKDQHDRSASSLGATTATAKIPIGFVVLTNHSREARWSPEVLTSGHTVIGMLEHAVAARRHPQRILSTLQHVAQRAVGWRGERGEAQETARAILARIDNG